MLEKKSTKEDIKKFYPKNRKEWHTWLEANHSKESSVWLIFYKKKTGKPSVIYSETVDEALCFGWIDSTGKPMDEEKFMCFFRKRKPKSVWSKVNKEKVERLITEGLMQKAGLEIIHLAKANGSWTILDEAEALIIPTDLETAFKKKKNSKEFFLSLSRTDKRNILQWLVLAKREKTRQSRINEIVTLAEQKLKPKQFS